MVLVASSTFSFDILESGLSIKPPLLAKRLITAVVAVLGVLLATRMGGIVNQLILGCQVIGILAPSLVGGMWLGERFKSAAFYSLIVGVVSFPIALAIPALGMKLAFVPAITLSTFTYLCVLAFKTRKLPN
jgi:Na+(H+)/acetate symporter ActP